jgi:dUTP pyrophosphatase
MSKKVKLLIDDAWDIPEYQTPGSAGVDLHANNKEAVMLKPGERKLIHTGIKLSIPEGLEAQIRPRSGLVLKHGVTVLNSPGTIDSDYRGEICVILYNAGDKNFFVNLGDRIAQMVFAKVEQVSFQEVSELESTERGNGGFGHTGK